MGLNRVSDLSDELQSVFLTCSGVPIMNSVLVKAIPPVQTMKMMSMKTKMTPMEPTFMKMLKSFLLQISEREKKRTRAQ